MRTRYFKIFLPAVTLLLLAAGCKKEEIMHYEGGGTLYFAQQATRYSFVETPFEQTGVISVEVVVGGPVEDFDRPIPVRINGMGENTTASMYRISSNSMVKAGADRGYVEIEVSNPDMIEGATTDHLLYLMIDENEYFKPGGFIQLFETRVEWSSDIIQPATWNDFALFCCARYSRNCYKAIIEATGLRELYYRTPDPDTGLFYTQYQCRAIGKVFGDWIREYNATHPEPYRHDDGTDVVPLY